MEAKIVAEFSAEHVSREHRPGPAMPRSRPLDPEVRAVMGPRFAYDFSRVRVHTDSPAAREHSALAYTTGPDIGFAPGQYRLDNPRGRALLAHELAHVVQQSGQPRSADAPVSSPGEAAERAADLAARTFGGTADPEPSVALSVRDRLRATKSGGPRLLRVASWAGDFITDTYDIEKNDPSASEEDGVRIILRFKPGKAVNATAIGMTQTANETVKGSMEYFPGAETRTIPTGQAGEGAHLDVPKDSPNPVYAKDLPDLDVTRTSTPGVQKATLGELGFRYSLLGSPRTKDAWIGDRPSIGGHPKLSGQKFETTALALTGAQAGTYYGSVEWGWKSDEHNKVDKLPLKLVSKDAPGATFAEAARLFAADTTSTGAKTIALPTVEGKFTNVVDAKLVANPSSPATSIIGNLAKNTRVELTDQGASINLAKNTGLDVTGQTPAAMAGAAAGAAAAAAGRAIIGAEGGVAPLATGPWCRVTVVGGVLIGQVGWVLTSQLSREKTP
jgi:hypothetical protein